MRWFSHPSLPSPSKTSDQKAGGAEREGGGGEKGKKNGVGAYSLLGGAIIATDGGNEKKKREKERRKAFATSSPDLPSYSRGAPHEGNSKERRGGGKSEFPIPKRPRIVKEVRIRRRKGKKKKKEGRGEEGASICGPLKL